MKFEQSPAPSPKEIAKTEKERALSDAELLENGAEYKFDEKGGKQLETTKEQIKEARKENADNIEAQIENLSSDEKELFDAWSHITEIGRNYSALRQAGKIDDSTFESLYSQLTSSDIAVKGKQLREKLGSEKSNRIGRLAGEFVKIKEVKKEDSGEKPRDDTSEKITPENIEIAIKNRNPIKVRVQRSSGQFETGWTVLGYSWNNGLAAVFKQNEDGSVTRKYVPLQELKEWQKEINSEELSNKLQKVESFEDLTKLLETSGGIQGSQEFHNAEQLINTISKVRKGELKSTAITRTGGLRQKVEDLLAIEKQRNTLQNI